MNLQNSIHKVYVLLINRQKHTTLEEIDLILPSTYTNFHYMRGFIAGICFDKFKLMSLEDYQFIVEKDCHELDNYWLRFVTVIPEDED